MGTRLCVWAWQKSAPLLPGDCVGCGGGVGAELEPLGGSGPDPHLLLKGRGGGDTERAQSKPKGKEGAPHGARRGVQGHLLQDPATRLNI